MIEWKKYDKENPPDKYKLFLVKHFGGITSGELNESNYGRNYWMCYNGNQLNEVTHYAEINLPESPQ